jgi:hypothetical protein
VGKEEMTYTQVDVIVEGALDSSEVYFNDESLTYALQQLKTEAENLHFVAEVYTLFHDHSIDVECECVQYVTDHHPTVVYGRQESARNDA